MSHNTGDDTGKTVMISGGGGGLGLSVVATMLERGANVIVPCRGDRDRQALDGLAGPRLERIIVDDLASEAEVEQLYRNAPPLWASIHLAGAFATANVTETTLAAFRAQLDINLVSCFLCSREAIRSMRKTGAGGRIVNVTARAALVPASGMAAYVTAKAAVSALTAALSVEVAPEGILVNAVAPSIIDTPANRAAMPTADFSRWPKAAELARAIAYLASADNTLTSGAIVPVYGRA